MTDHDQAVIALDDVRFRWPEQSTDTVRIERLRIHAGEHLFVRGASGSGKTTLLNLLAGINVPDSGRIELLGTDLGSLSAGRRDQFRADHLGVVFQQFNLLPYLSILENVVLSCAFSERRAGRAIDGSNGIGGGTLTAAAGVILRSLNLPADLHREPVSQLSVGQQQRVAVARALIGGPEIVIADEPTSALDADNRDRFIRLLFREVEARASTLVFVSHDPELSHGFTRTIELTGGDDQAGGSP